MSSESQRPLHPNGQANEGARKRKEMERLDAELRAATSTDMSGFHGDMLLADKKITRTGTLADLRDVLTWENASELGQVVWKKLAGKGVDVLNHLPCLQRTSISNSNGDLDGGRIPTYRLFAGEQREQSKIRRT